MQTSLTGPCLHWQPSQHILLCPSQVCAAQAKGGGEKVGFGDETAYLKLKLKIYGAADPLIHNRLI